MADVDASTPSDPSSDSPYASPALSALAERVRTLDIESLEEQVESIRGALGDAVAAAEARLLAQASSAIDSEVSRLIETLMPAIEQALGAERSEVETLRRELQAEQDRTEAARAGRKQSELAFREAEAALRQATSEKALVEEELRQAREALASSGDSLTQNTKVFEDAIEELRLEHAEAMKEQAVICTSLPLDELLTLFKSLAASGTVSDALMTFVKGLSLEFSRVALFSLHDARLEGVHQIGFDLNNDFSKVAISLTGDSLLGRAVASKAVESCMVGVDSRQSGIPFGGTPTLALALPIVVRGETLAVVYADDSDQMDFASPSPQLRMKFADLLLQHVVLVLIRISAEQHTRAELREYARTLLDELKYGYTADLGAGKTADELQRRLIDDLECSRRIFAQRSSQEGPEAAALFEDQLAAIIEESDGTGFGRDLAAVVGQSTSARRHLAS